MEEQLKANLRANAGVAARTAVINGRPAVDWVTRPDGSDLPALTLQRISSDNLYTQDGRAKLTGARVQFDCWGKTYGQVRLLWRAVLAAMDSPTDDYRAFLEDDNDSPPEDLAGGIRVFRVRGDFRIWYQET